MSRPARPAVSVVLPAKNAEKYLAQQLEALARQDFDAAWELLLVDNGSTDATAAVARSFGSKLPIETLYCDRPGVNAARNVGLSAAKADVVLFCDADDEVAPDWIRRMHWALSDETLVAGRIDALTLNPGVGPHVPHRAPGPVPVAGFLPRAITANLGVRRSVAQAVGGFNEAYRFGATDTEFCWRVQLAGTKIAYAPDAVVAWRRAEDTRTVLRKAYLTGRARAQLYRDFRTHGMPGSHPAGAVLRWAVLVLSAPVLLSASRRKEWLRRAAGYAGRAAGSVVFRVVYL